MPTFKITTLGCKVNHAESDAIAQALIKNGFQPSASATECDVCIINTCTVTQKGAMQSRQEIRKLIRLNPTAKVIVTGCHAQIGKKELTQIAGIDEIVDNRHKLSIPNRLQSSQATSACHGEQFPTGVRPTTRTRPFLKIQDGCNAFCSYCIVPFTRGRSCSMPMEQVSDNLRQLKMDGFREVVLTGIHLGHYGTDLIPQSSLYDLLDQIKMRHPIDRIRLSSIEPLELSDKIISLVIENDIFCNHFHIPLQSGDDAILKQMKRPYSVAYFSSMVMEIAEHAPDAAVGIDVLVGFPGETDQSFLKTYTLLESLPISYFHVFPFSARQGTAAYNFPDPVPAPTIKARSEQLRLLGREKKHTFLKRMVGKSLPVLIEGRRDRLSGKLKGLTTNYVQVLLSGENHLMNHLVEVNIKEVDEKRLVVTGSCTAV